MGNKGGGQVKPLLTTGGRVQRERGEKEQN